MTARLRATMAAVLFLPLLFVLGVTDPQPARAASSVNCSDGVPNNGDENRTFKTPRQFVEGQAWWDANRYGSTHPYGNYAAQGGDTTLEAGHVHYGACIPERESVSGTWNIYLRVQLHDHPGVLDSVDVVTKGDGYENKIADLNPNTEGYTDGSLGTLASGPMGGVGSTSVRWFKITVTDEDFAVGTQKKHGRQELRIRVFSTIPDRDDNVDGGNNRYGGTLIFQVNQQPSAAANGFAASVLDDYNRMPWLRSNALYKNGSGDLNTAYCPAEMKGATNADPIAPDAPVANNWRPLVAMADNLTAQADRPLSNYEAVINPNLHGDPLANPPVLPHNGTPVVYGDDDFPAANPPFNSTVNTQFAQLPITGLSGGVWPSGLNRLHLRGHCDLDEAAAEYPITGADYPDADYKPMETYMHAKLTSVLVVPFNVP